MIHYPKLNKDGAIGVTAPSSGVEGELHPLVYQAVKKLEGLGYKLIIGETVWTQEKAKSAKAGIRAQELQKMLEDKTIDLILPPWGGELLIEVLEHLSLSSIQPKWIMGYSDTSLILLAITLKTGLATAHGPNLIDLRGELTDPTTAMWENVLATNQGNSIIQSSSEFYQPEWDHENPSPCVFHLTEPTYWKALPSRHHKISGRLLGGCIDIIRHLIGTPDGNIENFRNTFINQEPIIWYFENCELSTTDLKRTLVQMKLAGWFKGCSGLLFGRSSANQPIEGYTVEDVYRDLFEELQIPIIYEIDCGHVPPQVTIVNGAFAEVEVLNGTGTIIQHLVP